MSFWNDPLKIAADWLEGVFVGWGMDAVLSHVLVAFLGVFLLISILMVLDIFLVWIERKVGALLPRFPSTERQAICFKYSPPMPLSR